MRVYLQRSPRSIVSALVLVAMAAAVARSQTRLYVDIAAPSGGDGLSWATAYQDLKPAVDYTVSHPSVTEIWVADGTYNTQGTPYRLKNGVSIYGGFQGIPVNETDLSQRDYTAYVTALSGEGTTRRVIWAVSQRLPNWWDYDIANRTAILDGFTITRGRDQNDPQSGRGGGGAYTYNGSPTFRNCTFVENTSTYASTDGGRGGGFYTYEGSPLLINCIFLNNSADHRGGGLHAYSGSAELVNCTFIGNHALGTLPGSNDSGVGGGIYAYSPVNLQLTNCLLAQNTASKTGGGCYTYDGGLALTNCTIAGNEAPEGAGVCAGPESPDSSTISNCIVWGNETGAVTGPWSVNYSCIQGGHDGTGNIDLDPRFNDPAGGEFWLAYGAGSPCIDAGNNGALPPDTYDLDGDGNISEPIPLGVDGFTRQYDDPATPDTGGGPPPIVDMGAFEYLDDCNHNGIPDPNDIAGGTSQDLNGNLIPDECEDCNGNGVLDDCDVTCQGFCASVPGCGQSADCNTNGVPDECELDGNDCNGNGVLDTCDIASGTSIDCNTNGLPDECELAGNDCNGNGVPDDCDIAGGASLDCQPDGIPDECQLEDQPGPVYQWDDGTRENWIGLSNGGYFGWLNRFEIQARGSVIEAVAISWGNVPSGAQITAYVWADPDGDGNPTDAHVLTWAATTVQNPGPNEFQLVDVVDVSVGPTGTSFFVGVIMQHAAGQSPAALDQTRSAGESWWFANGANPMDPNDLGAVSSPPRTIDSSGLPGNWMLRAATPIMEGDCNDNGVPDECDIVTQSSADCQPNGVPDECEIAAGSSFDLNGNGVPDECEDCNGNGIPDPCDLTCDGPCGAITGCGQSSDCQPDGVPDECQLGAAQNLLRRDDGQSELALGLIPGGALAWVNRFTVDQPRALQAVQTCFGTPVAPGTSGVSPGSPFGVYVWSDPDGDGNPLDAVLLAQAVGIAEAGSISTDVFQSVPISAQVDGSFFIGVSYQHAAGKYPAPMDQSLPQHNSWVTYNSVPYNPTVWDPANTFNMDDIDLACNWLLRAELVFSAPPNDCNLNGVPDECDIADGTSQDANGNGIPDECESLLGDLNGDGIVDIQDFAALADCLTGPEVPPATGCENADLDQDVDVDLADFSVFQLHFGAGR